MHNCMTARRYRSLTPEQKKILWDRTTMRQLLLCGVLWLIELTLWTNGLEFTTVPRASVSLSLVGWLGLVGWFWVGEWLVG